jgi:hypothetical protein
MSGCNGPGTEIVDDGATLTPGPASVGTATLRWLCREDAGAVAIVCDGSAGVAGNLALSGTPVLGLPHPWGSGIRFDGTATQFAFGASGVALATGAVTVMALVRPASLAGYAFAIRKNGAAAGSGGGQGYGLALNNTGDGRLLSELRTSVSGNIAVVSALPFGLLASSPHLIGTTYDGANQRLWIDGEIVATTPQTGTIVYGTGDWVLGADTTFVAGGATPWNGWVGDVRVCETVLTQAQIRAIYYQEVSRWSQPP